MFEMEISNAKNEWIGSKIVVLDSKNVTLKGTKGTVINETKNLIVIKNDNQKKISIPKKDVIFEIKINDKKEIIKGCDHLKRSYERIKF